MWGFVRQPTVREDRDRSVRMSGTSVGPPCDSRVDSPDYCWLIIVESVQECAQSVAAHAEVSREDYEGGAKWH